MSRAEKLTEYKKARRNPKGPEKRLYNVSEAACYLGRTVDALREMIWRGKLPISKDGRRVLVDKKDMDDFIERSKTRFTY
jgi:excisionase family DNA binding protein